MGKNPYIKASCLSDVKTKENVTKPLKQQKKKRKEKKKAQLAAEANLSYFIRALFSPLTRQEEVNGKMCVVLEPPADIQLHLQATLCQFS